MKPFNIKTIILVAEFLSSGHFLSLSWNLTTSSLSLNQKNTENEENEV
jgi:hypothetical protein